MGYIPKLTASSLSRSKNMVYYKRQSRDFMFAKISALRPSEYREYGGGKVEPVICELRWSTLSVGVAVPPVGIAPPSASCC